VPRANDEPGLQVEAEVLLEKYEGEVDPENPGQPIEVVRVKGGRVVERKLYPPPLDPTLAVNAQTMGAEDGDG